MTYDSGPDVEGIREFKRAKCGICGDPRSKRRVKKGNLDYEVYFCDHCDVPCKGGSDCSTCKQGLKGAPFE